MIKNLTVVKFVEKQNVPVQALDAALARAEFLPCSATQEISTGWERHGPNDEFARQIGRYIVMSFVTEKKTVPGAAKKEKLAELSVEYEAKYGEKPRKAALRELKDIARDFLLARAFPKKSSLQVWVDLDRYTLNFDTATRSKVDEALASISKNYTDFPVTALFAFENPLYSTLAGWILSDPPGFLTVDDKCELKSPTSSNSTIKYSRHSLDCEEVRSHLGDGMMPVNVAMTYRDRLSFSITSAFTFKSLAPHGVMKETIEDGLDKDALQDAEFLMMAHELGEMVQDTFNSI